VAAQVQESVDVIMAGGGTAGVIAAIAAARGGAKVRLVERHHFLGGMMTGGNAGLTLFTVYDENEEEYRKIISQLGDNPQAVHDSFSRGEMATFELKVDSMAHHVYSSPLPGVVTLGCPCASGSGLDVNDLTEGQFAMFKRVIMLREGLPGFEESYLIELPEIGVRETRHIQGDHVLTVEDILARTVYADSIGRGSHPIDAGRLPAHLKQAATEDHWYFNIPYRSLIVCGLDNLLFAGRCISATHEASGCTRPTVQCMITGQAAGTAAALCTIGDVGPRQ